MLPVWKIVAVVAGGLVSCYFLMFAFAGFLAQFLGPFAVVLPVAVGAGVWYVGVRYWIDQNALTVLRRRQLGLCERCGYDPRGNPSDVCPECGTAGARCGAGPPPLPTSAGKDHTTHTG